VVEGNLLTLLEEVIVKVLTEIKRLREIKRLKLMALMVSWACLIYVGFHVSLTPVWGDNHIKQFQGVVMEIDTGKRAIYVNEMKVLVPKGTEITTARDVRLSFESLRPKQWVFIQARLEREHLVADKIVFIPRYIPPRERGKYRFFTQTGISK
jgi:hypothetical protein